MEFQALNGLGQFCEEATGRVVGRIARRLIKNIFGIMHGFTYPYKVAGNVALIEVIGGNETQTIRGQNANTNDDTEAADVWQGRCPVLLSGVSVRRG